MKITLKELRNRQQIKKIAISNGKGEEKAKRNTEK